MSVLDHFARFLPTSLRHKIDATLARVIYRSGAAQPFHELNRRVVKLEHAKGNQLMFDYFEARLDNIYANLLKTPTFGPAPTSPAASFPSGFFTAFADELTEEAIRLRGHDLATVRDVHSYLRVHQKRMEVTLQLLQKLDLPEAGVLLDLGSHAPFVPMLQRLLPNYDTICVTSPDEQVHATEVDQRRLRWLNLDLETETLPLADESVQVVLLLEMIEHLYRDPMFVMAEVNRVLMPGGKVVISTPNLASWRALAAVLTSFSPYTHGKYAPDHPRNRHVHEYVPRDVIALLTSAGFVAECFTENVYHSGGSERIATLLSHLGLPLDMRGDSIFAVGVKSGPVVERYPDNLYDVAGHIGPR